MPDRTPSGEREARDQADSAKATLREILALVDAGEFAATAAQRAFLCGVLAAQNGTRLLYK